MKLDKPSITDKLKTDDYLEAQKKQLHKRMTQMFLPVVQKAKLVERAERLLETDKKREEKMKAERLKLENIIRQMQKVAEKNLASLRMVEILQEENAEQKKTIEWYEEKFSTLNPVDKVKIGHRTNYQKSQLLAGFSDGLDILKSFCMFKQREVLNDQKS